MQELYNEFQDKLVIIGFPSNDFGGQKPGTNEEIQAFCETRYGVDFPLGAKITIKGTNVYPVYQWLTRQSKKCLPAGRQGIAESEVRWNFHKYLLDENRQLLKFLPSTVSPLDEQILDWLNS